MNARSRRLLPARGILLATATLAVVALLAAAGNSAAGPRQALGHPGKTFWVHVAGKLEATHDGKRADVRAKKLRALTLDPGGLERLLRLADGSVVVSLPDAKGGFQRFELRRSHLMAPGLAEKHPEISTFRGRGLDDPTATIHADLSPLGFHASVRSAGGSWYIDPYYHLDRSLYASYYGRDVPPAKEILAAPFVERDAEAGEISVDRGYYHAEDTVTVSGAEFDADATVTLTISDPEESFATRTLAVEADGLGAFEAQFVADPDGNLGTHIVQATAGDEPVSTSYEVVDDEHSTEDPPTGDVRRTYRLALITDPGYAAYHGGPANVTAAKVALMNRVSQVYEDDLSISLQLIANNDLLNLDTWAQAIGPNGPCGTAGCFTQSQVTGCSSTGRARFVIGQIIGASNYDLGHLALGQPGGGVANLGVVGRSNKAGGCTGIPTPTGDFYAIDYVSHEMGHQFAGNHPFNGNQLNCSGGNRSAGNSVEPGSGSSIMAYAGICLTDDLQPHSDPYFSERSLQEISTYTSSNQAAINEVQTASLRHFGGGNEVQVVTFGPGYAPTSTIQPLSVNINAAPSPTSRGGAMEVGNTVTIATATPHTLQVGDTVTMAGVAEAGYNGTFTVTAVLTTRAFQYTNTAAGLPRSGGGTVTLAAPGLSESGTTATVRTAAVHGRAVGQVVTLTGAGSYNGTWTITAVPTPRSFEFTHTTPGLASAGGGTVTFFSPFRVRIGGNDSNVIGGTGVPYNNANLTSEINAIAGFAGTVAVTGAASTGFTITYGGGSASTDVPSVQLVDLGCGGCFGSVEETNHGGANDSFTLNYDGSVSAPIVNGANFSADGIQTALQGASEVQTVSLTGYTTDGDSYTLNYNSADTVAITRGQNNTVAGIAAALQGGNEQQQVTLAGFNAANPGSSFQIQIGGNNSEVLGNGGLAINNANVTAAVNAIPGFAGTVTSAGAGNAGFTLTFAEASANTDVPSIAIVNLGCSPACTATVRETVKGTPPVAGWPAGGTVTVGSLTDSGYTLTFSGAHQGTDVSLVTLTNLSSVAGSTVETTKGAAGIVPVGSTATVAGFGGGAFNTTGFQVTFGGSLAGTNVPVLLAMQDFTLGASGWTGETDKGGAVDNKGGTITPTGNTWPSVTAPAEHTIPLRTPFALTGTAVDAEGDGMTFAWEQNDRGGAAGTSLLSNTKTNGPLFAMFPQSGQISETDTLLYNSPGENHLTGDPTRVFPDLQQILDNNTNADTGSCPDGPIAPPVPIPVKECFAEFLPTADYVGFSGGGTNNASPLSLHLRFTARDGKGGANSADTLLLIDNAAGPFLVTAPNTSSAHWTAGSTRTVTWDVAGTNTPALATDVKISLSTDGGYTYPWVLASSTPNDGSQTVTVPNVATTKARVKVEAVGNVFFDLSNANFTVTLPGIIGLDSVSLSGNATLIDSYDSSAGRYGGANRGDDASLFSNGSIGLDAADVHGDVRSAQAGVVLKSGGLVTGDVTAGTTISNKGTIQGTATPSSPTPPIAAPPVPACSPYSDGSGLGGSYRYNAATGDLTVTGGKAATLGDGEYCFRNVTLSGGATLSVSGPVKIVLNGKLHADGASLLNTTRVPANLELASSLAGGMGITLSASAQGYLSVYAPQTGITLNGGAPLNGALLGKSLTLSGKAAVHYDVRLVDVWGGYFNNP